MSTINNITDLARHLGVPECYEGCLIAAVSKAVYKYTECGCVFNAFDGGVIIAGYAEGVDAECESFQFNYPFGSEEFDEQLRLCDEEGCELFYEYNEEW